MGPCAAWVGWDIRFESQMKTQIALLILLGLGLGAQTRVDSAQATRVEFSRDIRPILSDNCFACHGPDQAERKAKLRLDTEEGMLAVIEGRHVVKPGSASESELVRRISTEDHDDLMPPPESGKSLTPQQVALIRQWIDEGAKWELHWAFVKPAKAELPAIQHAAWPRNPIDNFTVAAMERNGLAPSPEADKQTLIRRVTMDLTGLPPALEEIDAYLADNSSEAYEKVVDRLLQSKNYGEHMGRHWLDAARYADSHGYHIDAPRMVWKYREWVINAFNSNKPFDEFTIEQLAGDMLPDATVEQRIGSGFNRCNMSTGEGGAIEEEYRVKYAADRVETAGTIWLGLTVGCAQCHTHKFDPITHKEFYQMAAIFNSIAENAMDGNAPAPPPNLKVPSPEQAAQLADVGAKIADVKRRMDEAGEKLDADQLAWQTKWREKLGATWTTLKPAELKAESGATFKDLGDGSYLVEGEKSARDAYELTFRTGPGRVKAFKLEALTHESLAGNGPGRSDNGNFVLSEFQVSAAPLTDPARRQPVRLADSFADFSQKDYPISNAIDGKTESGWAVEGQTRHENRLAIILPESPVGYPGGAEIKVTLRFASVFAAHAIGRVRISVATEGPGLDYLAPIVSSPWQVAGPFAADTGKAAFDTDYGPEDKVDLTETFADGSLAWKARPDLEDGKLHSFEQKIGAVYLYRTIHASEPRDLSLGFGSDDALKVWLNGKLVLDQNVQRGAAPDQNQIGVTLQPGQNELLVKVVNYGGAFAFHHTARNAGGELPRNIAFQLFASASTPDEAQQKLLRNVFRENYSPEWKALTTEMASLGEERKKIDAAVPVTMVSEEMKTPRDTFTLIRGEYDKRGDKVEPGVPSVLPPLLHEGERATRLDFARWLVDEENPLTSRVTVNRFWQRYFGNGIVKTAEDFGSQGDSPTHPALLDWLAVDFMEKGWNVKQLQRLIVTSATYRQSSKVTPLLLEKDPANKFLARGPRFRADAEVVRDGALAISGLLVGDIGGPSVKPYQPPGLWTEVSYGFREDYVVDKGPGLYRRSLYTYWKRQSPPPGMTTFDAPSREVCSVKRPRTNTPLQALALMNDPQYVEAARAFAVRVLKDGGKDNTSRLVHAFRLATSRFPTEAETRALEGLLAAQREHYAANPEDGAKLQTTGDMPPSESHDPSEMAAWTIVCSTLLNLDATITKS